MSSTGTPGNAHDSVARRGAQATRQERELAATLFGLTPAARQVARDSILEITNEQFDDTFTTNCYANF